MEDREQYNVDARKIVSFLPSEVGVSYYPWAR